MEFLIVSGMSGAGKSHAADVLEDMDFYCVDNMPAAMLPRFAEFCMGMSGRYEKVALVTDIRDRGGFEDMAKALDALKGLGCAYHILFVEANVPTVVKRYKESRRPHPLQHECRSIEQAVNLEASRLGWLRDRADYIINTSNLTLSKLQSELYRLFAAGEEDRPLAVNVMSFGFKYGLPIEADIVFDVRFLPNPFYEPELRGKTGLDAEVRDYIFKTPVAHEFLQRLGQLISFLIPQYVQEGKHTLTIAVGCTGGRHRSVAVARALTELIKSLGQSAENINRDIDK